MSETNRAITELVAQADPHSGVTAEQVGERRVVEASPDVANGPRSGATSQPSSGVTASLTWTTASSLTRR